MDNFFSVVEVCNAVRSCLKSSEQIDSMLPCVCSVIDHRGRQNMVRTSVTHSAAPRVPLFFDTFSVTHSAAPRVPLFCSYHILTSYVIYY